jgi:hypothetical protein
VESESHVSQSAPLSAERPQSAPGEQSYLVPLPNAMGVKEETLVVRDAVLAIGPAGFDVSRGTCRLQWHSYPAILTGGMAFEKLGGSIESLKERGCC